MTWNREAKWNREALIPFAISAGAVAVAGLAAYAAMRVLPLPQVSVLFLAAVVVSATLWGFWPSALAALLSVAAAAYFFYTPVFSLRVMDARDVADLAVFVIVAALTSLLGSTVRARALEARRQEARVAGLLAFSQRLAEATSDAEIHTGILEHLAPVLGRPIHLLLAEPGGRALLQSLGDAAPLPPAVEEAARRAMATEGRGEDDPQWRIERLSTAQGAAGVVVARKPSPPADAEYANALLGHAALALERSRLRREIAEARVQVQGEKLREALINSVSHDLQTPLAAILGSASALETFGPHGDHAARRELAATIREEAERLAHYIDNVLDLTRIRSGHIAPRLEMVELADIVDAALRRKRGALARHEVDVKLPPDLPMLRLDLFLMEHALANVLDNAAKHAPSGSTLRVDARTEGGEVVLDIADRGGGIPPEELEKVFDAFYRGKGLEGAPARGTGLGLAICRAFVEANGGRVAALSEGPGRGATVRVRLPIPEGVLLEEGAVADD